MERPAGGLDHAGGATTSDGVVHRDFQRLQALGAFRNEPVESGTEVRAYLDRLVRTISTNVTLIVSQACDLACRYCYAQGGTFGGTSRLMDISTARRAVEWALERARAAEQIGVVFFGGEPLLNFKVVREIVEYSERRTRDLGKNVFFSMTTNATRLSDEAIELICRHRFGLKVSMDGPRGIHDRARPFKDGTGSYSSVARNLRKLLRRRRHLSVRATVTREFLDVNELVSFFEQFGFRRVGIGFATGTCFEKGPLDMRPEDTDRLLQQDEETMEILLAKLDRGERIVFNPFEEILGSIHHRRRVRIRCGLGRGCSTVDVDGRIYPCHRYVGMEAYVLGDIERGVSRQRVRDLLLDYYGVKSFCWSTCWARHLCGGPCPWYVAHPDGHHRAPDRAHCDLIRGVYEMGIWLYDELRRRHPAYLESLLGAPVERDPRIAPATADGLGRETPGGEGA